MKTLKSTHKAIITRFHLVSSQLKSEVTFAKLLGETEFTRAIANVHLRLERALIVAEGNPIWFTAIVDLLGSINLFASELEKSSTYSMTEESSGSWLRQAYVLRQASEVAATALLHAAGTEVPQFESSVASLRLTCAALARELGLDSDSMAYVQGALRLSAPEALTKSTKAFMQHAGSTQ